MGNFTLMLAMLGILIGTGIMAVVFLLYLDRSTPAHLKEARMRLSDKRMLQIIRKYNKWDNNFILRPGLRRAHRRLSEIGVYTEDEAKVRAFQFYRSTVSALAIITLTGLFLYWDLFMVLVFFTTGFVYKTFIIDKKLDKEHFKMLNQLLISLSNIRQAYMREQSIPEALNTAELKPYVQRPLMAITEIITSNSPQKKLENFLRTTPYRVIKTFAIISYILHSTGDAEGNSGTSAYIDAIDMMENEVRLEIRRLDTQKKRFGMLLILPISPIAALKVIELFFLSTIPGTGMVYNGPLGYISKVVIVALSLIGYSSIVQMSNNIQMRQDDREGLSNQLLNMDGYKSFIESITPKKVVKVQKKMRLINGAMSMMNLKNLYSKKVLGFITAFTITILVMVASTYLGKSFIYNSLTEVSLVKSKPLDPELIPIQRKMDEKYLALPKALSEKDTREYVNAHLPTLLHLDIETQTRRLMTKRENYYNTYFKWNYVFLAYLFGLLGWITPELGLKLRKWLIDVEASEDVLQLQTLIAIIMNSNLDTLDCLYWMTQTSNIHKRVIRDCYHDYPSNPEFALLKLKLKTVVPEFKRMVDRLRLTIVQVSLKEVFGELEVEREHMLKMREAAQDASIHRKRGFASWLAKAPVAMLVILYVVMPLGILAVKEFSQILPNIQGGL